MDTARLAAMADPIRNPLFSKRWTTAPPNRKGPADQNGASPKIITNANTAEWSTPALAAQRAVKVALARAEQLDRRAQLFAQIGLRDAALRSAMVAAGIRTALG